MRRPDGAPSGPRRGALLQTCTAPLCESAFSGPISSWHLLPIARGARFQPARVKEAAREFGHRDAQLVPQAALQAAIILRAAKDVANQLAKRWRIVHQLYHARRDRPSQEIPAEKLARQMRRKFQIRRKR